MMTTKSDVTSMARGLAQGGANLAIVSVRLTACVPRDVFLKFRLNAWTRVCSLPLRWILVVQASKISIFRGHCCTVN